MYPFGRLRMMPWPWISVLFILSLQALSSAEELIWFTKAWIPTHICGAVDPDFPSELSPFWIDTIVGMWEVEGNSAKLDLHILAVHNTTLVSCDGINVSLFEKSLEFQVLGYPVGQLERFWSKCPLPHTERLSPFYSDNELCSYHMIYNFQSAHRLQAVESTFSFKDKSGQELDCAIAKITPDMGKSISAAFTYTPLGILALVTVSSWLSHQQEFSFSYVFHRGSTVAGPLWPTVLDITGYLRYLQFVFISASMSMQYPGFYVPAVGKLAWANLVLWEGPVFEHHTYEGPTGGMYPSNASYGLNFMGQMIGYPYTLGSPFNFIITFFALTLPILLFTCLSFWILLRSSPVQPSIFSVFKKAAVTTIGIALCLFSVPLLSYISYDLILVGYLPDYRIGLAILMLLIIIGASHFLLRILDGPSELKPTQNSFEPDGPALDFQAMKKVLSRHIPHSMPLMQAVGVGSLQDFPSVQLFVLVACECVFISFHLASKKDKRIASSLTAYLSLIRLLAVLPMIVFVLPTTSAAKQWTGYAILGFHGVVISVGYSATSLWKLYRALSKRSAGEPANVTNGVSNSNTVFHLEPISSLSPSNPLDHSRVHSRESSWQDHQQNPSSFYRPPRSPSTAPSLQIFQPTTSLGTGKGKLPAKRPGEGKFDMGSVLSEVSPNPGVDYSFREADRFYGIAEDRVFSTPTSIPTLNSTSGLSLEAPSPASKTTIHGRLVDGITKTFRRPKPKPIEKGFQVRRPPRPPP